METQATPTPKPVTPDFIPTSVFQPFIFSFLSAIKQNPAQEKVPLERKNRVCSIVKEYDTSGFIAGGIACGLQLDYFGARYYDADVGVWTSTDPKEQDWNVYAYCDNDPANRSDPNGETWNWILSVVGSYVFPAMQYGWNPLDWNWRNLDTYTSILGGANAGYGIGSLVDNVLANSASLSQNSLRGAQIDDDAPRYDQEINGKRATSQDREVFKKIRQHRNELTLNEHNVLVDPKDGKLKPINILEGDNKNTVPIPKIKDGIRDYNYCVQVHTAPNTKPSGYEYYNKPKATGYSVLKYSNPSDIGQLIDMESNGFTGKMIIYRLPENDFYGISHESEKLIYWRILNDK